VSKTIALIFAAILAGCGTDMDAPCDDDGGADGDGDVDADGDADADADGDADNPTGALVGGVAEEVCDGSLGAEIAAGFPRLGERCRSRFQYHWTYGLFDTSGEEDVGSRRGVRRFPDDVSLSRFDLGVPVDDWYPIALFLPSLEPGTYRFEDGAYAASFIGSPFLTQGNEGEGILIVVEGRTDAVVWGRFVAHMCWNVRIDDCYTLEAGRFSAAIDQEPSAYELGEPYQGESRPGVPVCEEDVDCEAPSCSIGRCVGFRCEGEFVPGACPEDQWCDWDRGCIGLE
jgi:hypothetical protein